MPGRWNDPDTIFKPGAVDVSGRPSMQRGYGWNLSGNPDKSVTG
jgi:hypothetical protein